MKVSIESKRFGRLIPRAEARGLRWPSFGHISEMEAGNTVPTVFVAKRLARVLGVSVDELIAEEE